MSILLLEVFFNSLTIPNFPYILKTKKETPFGTSQLLLKDLWGYSFTQFWVVYLYDFARIVMPHDKLRISMTF